MKHATREKVQTLCEAIDDKREPPQPDENPEKKVLRKVIVLEHLQTLAQNGNILMCMPNVGTSNHASFRALGDHPVKAIAGHTWLTLSNLNVWEVGGVGRSWESFKVSLA